MACLPLVIEADEDDPDCATIFVDGSIAGRPYRFVLDTGTPKTHVIADDYLMSLPSHAQHYSSGVIGTHAVDLVLLPHLTIGPLTLTSFEVTRFNADQPGGRNLLGMDVIGSWASRFDFAGESWELAPTGTLVTRWSLDRSARGHNFVEVVWPEVTARACWDSGAGLTLIDSRFLASYPELFEFAAVSVGTDATGAQVEGPTYLVRDARIGDMAFAPHRAAMVDLPQDSGRFDMVLGYPALRQAVWVFDFPARRWALQPAAG